MSRRAQRGKGGIRHQPGPDITRVCLHGVNGIVSIINRSAKWDSNLKAVCIAIIYVL